MALNQILTSRKVLMDKVKAKAVSQVSQVLNNRACLVEYMTIKVSMKSQKNYNFQKIYKIERAFNVMILKIQKIIKPTKIEAINLL